MGTEYLCDCYFGIKGKLCKHSMGLVYLLEPSFEVAPTLNPLKFVGRKRGKGRPALVAPALDKRLPKNIRITEINREIPHDDQEDAVQITIDNPVEISKVREDVVQVDLENPVENSEVIEDQYEESVDITHPHPNISSSVLTNPLPTIPSLISEQSGRIRCEHCNTIVSKKSFAKHKRSKLCLAHQGSKPAPVSSTCLPLTCLPPSTMRKRDDSIPRRVL